MSAVVADPGWRAQANDDGLVLYAGADLNYLVPDLSPAHTQALVAWFEAATAGPVDAADLPGELAAVVRQLRSLGAVRPAALPTPERPRVLGVDVRTVGSTPAALTTALHETFPPRVHADTAEPDLLLVVRTTETLRELAELAGELAEPPVPHLLLDLAYHHTVVLGPLVVPGASACLACLAVRTGRRWGDPPPPQRPVTAEQPELPLALAAHAIRRLGAGSLALLERTVSMHAEELTSTAENVLPAADCPVCPGLPTGPATLPWEAG
ncbi:hypothetical protein [Qaidamihabitans albus]|uniref:hypothetical protein n=1 Tax=Qaidamihabitans albus TaxID=2795733 RepID=UPI0018F1E6FC|nr:hypothetical protein [Qaidamihabitans albus]